MKKSTYSGSFVVGCSFVSFCCTLFIYRFLRQYHLANLRRDSCILLYSCMCVLVRRCTCL